MLTTEATSLVAAAQTPTTPRAAPLSLRRAMSLPLAFTLALLAFGLLGSVRQNPKLLASFLGAAATLMVWNAALFVSAHAGGRTLALAVTLRTQHYLQACAQGSVLLYWGWYWREVYGVAHLIAAQLIFAYAFDMLLGWTRRDTYTLGFGPFPVIFSINLFLWFKPDWFYLQFLMVAIGFAGKELIRWEKNGRQAHIFNPSSFTLAVFSLALLLTGKSELTRGQDIASTQFYPPHIYLMLFLVGLPGQFFFAVTFMTMSAVMTTYLFGLAYYAATGTFFFYDSYVPIAVFLGMHLLFTDPSTSPRTELGRMFFGMLYGLSVVFLYEVLGSLGLPTFYDKLLPVPILNLSINLIDLAAQSPLLRAFDPGTVGRWLAPRQRNLAYMTVWAVAFAAMSAARGVGDDHPGQWLPFWRRACEAERPYACRYLADVQAVFCDRGSGWACNELGILQARHEQNRVTAVESMLRGCDLKFSEACANAERARSARESAQAPFRSAPPTLDDYAIILRGTKGPIAERTPKDLYALACREGWPDTCLHDP
jgi:hypothetical protein